MKQKQIVSLAIVTMVAVAAAIYTVEKRNGDTSSSQTAEQLLPDLGSKVNTIDEITVQSHDESVTVKKGADGTWVVASKYDYPADFETVKKTIVGLTDMTVVEPKTADPKLFPELGLADVAAEDSKAKLIALRSGGKAVASLLFGERKYVPGIGGARGYVRKADGGRAWLVDNAADVQTDVKRWMAEDTVTVARDRIKDVTLDGPDRRALTVYRDAKDEKDFKIRNMPKGAKLSYEGAPDSIAGALANVSFDDVKPVGDVDFAGADTARFRTFGGLEVTVRLVKLDKDSWAKFEAVALPGASVPAKAETPASDAASDKDASAAQDGQEKAKTPDVPAEAKAINARVAGWAYKLPDYRAENFTKRLDDLLAKDKKETKKATKP